MKINYVAYLDPFHFSGGGEMIMNDLLSYAKNIGFEVYITSIRPYQKNYQKDVDLTILCDIFNEPTLSQRFDLSFIQDIVETDRYIHFDNSYVDTCDLAYLPCNGNNQDKCKHKSIFNLKSNIQRRTLLTKCFQSNELINKIYINSSANIFLSPLHYTKVSQMLNIEEKEYFILRPTVDTKKFYNKNQERDIEFIFAGAISEAKGVENLKEYFKNTDKKLLMIGENIYEEELSFAEYTGFISYEEMPNYFNRAKNFIYLPRWPEPQGRVVVEAALCGCSLITNENVGATSFEFDISSRENLQGAVEEFWEYINIKLKEM
jgi:glycosyltransferase involved in cell wall biosynthesis